MLKIKVKRNDFLKSIRIVENAIEDDKMDGTNTGVYIECLKDRLEFKGIGNTQFIKCSCEANIIEEGNISIKYKLIEEYLKKIDDEEIEIIEKSSSIVVKASGGDVSFKLLEYVKPIELAIYNGAEYVFDKKRLLENVETTVFASSTDISKQSINSVKFDILENTLKIVATDSYRLMFRELDVLENSSNSISSINIPLKTIQTMIKVMKDSKAEEVIFKAEANKILFKIEDVQDVEVYSKVVEVEFPDYNSILKNVRTTKEVKVSNYELKKNLEIVSLFVKDKKERKDVAEFLFTSEGLHIKGSNELAAIDRKVNIDYEGEDIKIYLNVKYILDFLNTIKDERVIEIKLSEPLSPILMNNEMDSVDNKYLTMPLKI